MWFKLHDSDKENMNNEQTGFIAVKCKRISKKCTVEGYRDARNSNTRTQINILAASKRTTASGDKKSTNSLW